MKSLIILFVAIVLVVSVVEPAAAGYPSREPLDGIWQEHMLAGTAADYGDGKEFPYQPKKSAETAAGSVFSASLAERGIRISDRRGTRFLGLIRAVGWTLDGGMVGRASATNVSLELYGKRVIRWNGGFLGLDTYAGKDDVSYEFFLLKRPAPGQRAEVVKRWVVGPQEIHWDIAKSAEDVRGFLGYDPEARVATVTVTGLTHPLEERIDISNDK